MALVKAQKMSSFPHALSGNLIRKKIMPWNYTEHIKLQMVERKISKELVEMVINNPDEVLEGKNSRKIYQKIDGSKLIRVVAEENNLVTVYKTDKIKKYSGVDK